jgi:CRP-like cAMP-binding protein
MRPPPHPHPLLRKLQSIARLTEGEASAAAAMPIEVRNFNPGEDIIREGDHPSHSFVLLAGLAATYKVTGPGARQIVAFHVTGDMPDLQSLHLDTTDSAIAAVARCAIGFVAHEDVREICRLFPGLGAAFWKMTLIEAATFREWIVNVGQRNAAARLAHLFCEIYTRLNAVGMVQDKECELSLTQLEIADATGMTTVHVNRMLQDLRGDGLIRLKQKKLSILNWNELARVADFDPTYLHLRGGRSSPQNGATVAARF